MRYLAVVALLAFVMVPFIAGCQESTLPKPAPKAAKPAGPAPLPSQPSGTSGSPVAFDTYGGYFVSNKFESTAAESFVVLRDQASFDQVFGAAFVMRDKSHRLPAQVFDSMIVVAAIKRGKAVWEFKVQDVRAEGGVLTIRYSVTSKPSDSAEFACPLIVSVAKGDYTAVQFVENDKPVKKVEAAQPRKVNPL